MRWLVLLLLIISSPAFAGADEHTLMRETYMRLWKPTILNMFADAGPTQVKLKRNVLLICNPNCNDPGVKAVLTETFSAPSIRKTLKEIDMTVQCVPSKS